MSKKKNWTQIDEDKGMELTTETNTPGVVYGLDPAALPDNFKSMSGVSSYYMSESLVPQALDGGKSLKGEFLVARKDGPKMKHYNYAFAVNSEGSVFYTGLPKGYGHHVNSGESFEVSSLFHHPPYPDL